MKLITTCFLLFLFAFSGYAQDLTCKDFRKGTFYIPIKSEKDTIYFYRAKDKSFEKSTINVEKGLKKFIVLRDLNKQVEWKNEVNNGEPMHQKIKWIDRCKYILTVDKNKQKLDQNDLFINENGGLIIENVEIKGRCMKYKSSIKVNNGDKLHSFGFICKE